jgi:uncharacterized protein YhfF
VFPRVDDPDHGTLRCLELGTPGPMRQELNDLVRRGVKTATAGRAAEYADEGEAFEHVGERLVLVDDDLAPIGTVVVTAFEVVPFRAVPWWFADAEGEGFTDIDDWRAAHRRFWRRDAGVEIPDDEPIALLSIRWDG